MFRKHDEEKIEKLCQPSTFLWQEHKQASKRAMSMEEISENQVAGGMRSESDVINSAEYGTP
jgi:hypothetical protein